MPKRELVLPEQAVKLLLWRRFARAFCEQCKAGLWILDKVEFTGRRQAHVAFASRLIFPNEHKVMQNASKREGLAWLPFRVSGDAIAAGERLNSERARADGDTMTSEGERLCRVAKMPGGYIVTFSCRVVGKAARDQKFEWEPGIPKFNRSSREWHEFRDAYNIARREFFTEVANKIRGGVMVVDLDGRIEVIAPSK